MSIIWMIAGRAGGVPESVGGNMVRLGLAGCALACTTWASLGSNAKQRAVNAVV